MKNEEYITLAKVTTVTYCLIVVKAVKGVKGN